MSHETRGSGRNYYYYTRNYILIAFKDYSGWRRWQYLSYNLGMLLWFTLRTRFPNKFAAGIRDGVRNLHALKPTPVSEYTFVRLKELNRYRPGIIDRFRRHWAKPLI
jgi:hypothetical protein